MNEYTEEQI